MKTSKLLEVHVTDDGRAFAVFEKKLRPIEIAGAMIAITLSQEEEAQQLKVLRIFQQMWNNRAEYTSRIDNPLASKE